LASSLVVATYNEVRLTPRFLAAWHLDLFDQPALGTAFFSTLLGAVDQDVITVKYAPSEIRLKS
jgi:hypothetical protein